MLLLCCGLFGSYYIFDIPAATENAMAREVEAQVQSNTTNVCVNGTLYNVTTSDAANDFNNNFNLLYSVYSWPNIILPFFGGYITDRLGVRLMGVIFMALVTFGQLIVALGSSYLATNPQAAWTTM